jgi:hypothetical protein
MKSEFVNLVENSNTLNFNYEFASQQDMEKYHQVISDPRKREMEQKAKFNDDEKEWEDFFKVFNINGTFTMGDKEVTDLGI